MLNSEMEDWRRIKSPSRGGEGLGEAELCAAICLMAYYLKINKTGGFVKCSLRKGI
jgi:hypothetical protein